MVDDFVPFVHDGQREARVDPAAIDEDGARAALAVIAAFLAAGELQVFAQRVEQRHARVELEGLLRAVDLKIDAEQIGGARGCRGGRRGGGGRSCFHREGVRGG